MNKYAITITVGSISIWLVLIGFYLYVTNGNPDGLIGFLIGISLKHIHTTHTNKDRIPYDNYVTGSLIIILSGLIFYLS